MPCDLKSMLGGSKSLDIWDRDSMPDRVVMFTSLILRHLVASEPLPPSGLSTGEVSPQSETEHCPGRAPVSAWWWACPAVLGYLAWVAPSPVADGHHCGEREQWASSYGGSLLASSYRAGASRPSGVGH